VEVPWQENEFSSTNEVTNSSRDGENIPQK